MSMPPDDALLARLDERARAAVADLDAELGNVEIPDLGLDRKPRRKPRFLIAVAAGTAAVALVGALVILDRDGRDNTVAGVQELSYLALLDPEAAGFELVAAFDGSDEAAPATSVNPESEPGYTDPAVTVQGAADADDPWAAAFIDLVGPAASMAGDVVDLAGVEGTFSSTHYGNTVQWLTQQGSRALISARLDQEQLVAVAADVVSSGAEFGSEIPGQELLFAGRFSDVYPIAASLGPQPGDRGLGYRSVDGDGVLVLTFAAGSNTQRRATAVLSSETSERRVRGQAATLASFRDGTQELAWIEGDTLVRVMGTGSGDPDRIAQALERLSAEDFLTLVDQDLPGLRQEPLSLSEIDDEGSLIHGTAMVRRDSVTYWTTLSETADGRLRVEVSAESSGSVGGAYDLLDDGADDIVMLLPDRGVVGGLVGPEFSSLEIADTQTGAPVSVSGMDVVELPDSGRLLFICLIDENREGPFSVDVVGTREDGSEVRVTSQ